MADSDTPKRSNGSSHTSKSLSSFLKNISTVFTLGNVLTDHLKKTDDSRALQDLSVVMFLAGNFLLNFTVMGTLTTVLLVLSYNFFFF